MILQDPWRSSRSTIDSYLHIQVSLYQENCPIHYLFCYLFFSPDELKSVYTCMWISFNKSNIFSIFLLFYELKIFFCKEEIYRVFNKGRQPAKLAGYSTRFRRLL